ncbi:MAG TPA: hypothetical protein VH183_08620 [Burkholderiaceae bacterium]|jgi:hypothetical protein|nr:hypothetical protein [Burkholderiaceae bacterium]
MSRAARSLIAPIFLLSSGAAAAHMMGVVYNLPIPFWMYAFAASGALALSFLMVGYFVTAQSAARNFQTLDLGVPAPAICKAVLAGLRVLSVFALLLTILSGLFGPANPFANFSMTFFWVVFALGFMYLTGLIGDVYAQINPWRVMCDWIERFNPGAFRPRVQYPRWLGYYPALAFYMAFIWLELFGQPPPRGLGAILIGYSVANVAAAAVFGADAWFRYGELFAVFLRLIGKIAPFDYRIDPATGLPTAVRLRQPFIGLLQEPADHFSLLLFVLFMLSSTAFDGLHETRPWVLVFWKGIYPHLASLVPGPYLVLVDFYYYWQWAMLFVSPFVYLAVYLLFVWMMKIVTGSGKAVRDLALQFALTLIPIAFVYNITHYYTLLVSQGPMILSMISDPFGLGWDLFGTARTVRQPIILLADSVWHTQVGLILFGHIVSVYLAHVLALETFPRGRQGVVSQFPMLALMMLLTTVGLRILSLPIAAGQVQDPLPTGSAGAVVAMADTRLAARGAASALTGRSPWRGGTRGQARPR